MTDTTTDVNTEAAPSAGGNINEMMKTIKDAHAKLTDLEGEREMINAEVNAERKRVKAAGIPLKVLDHARKIADMDDDDRGEYDNLMDICRDALGIGQGELAL